MLRGAQVVYVVFRLSTGDLATQFVGFARIGGFEPWGLVGSVECCVVRRSLLRHVLAVVLVLWTA